MKIAKARRERLFKHSRPDIRPAVYEDIRWLWVASRRSGTEESPEEFSRRIEPFLADCDRLWMLWDKNSEFESGDGPVGLVMANDDGWTLAPHVEWFAWATPRNKLRCTVGFLQSMRYTNGVGCIKIFSTAENAEWFKRLKRYTSIILAGRIPGGRPSGEEYIFYLRGRKQGEHRQSIRRVKTGERGAGIDHPAAPGSNATH